MTSRPRRVVARDYGTAYDYRARYFSDPVMMTGRDRALTEFKIGNVASRLPVEANSEVLDVGPGDGTLFRTIAGQVSRCVGVDPSESAVTKLRALFADVPNVSFEVGTCTDLPDFGSGFDVVVINSVIHMLASEEEVRQTLTSLARACRPGGTVFVGEVPFRQERQRGLLAELWTQFTHLGVRRVVTAIGEMYLQPLLRGEPLLMEPVGRTLAFTPSEFSRLAKDAGFEAVCFGHPEPRGPSSTRKDYLLTRGT